MNISNNNSSMENREKKETKKNERTTQIFTITLLFNSLTKEISNKNQEHTHKHLYIYIICTRWPVLGVPIKTIFL